MTRPILTLPIGFAPPVVEKVERLLEVLSAVREDQLLREAFVLHGGTALNLFRYRAARLSIDIDLMFVGAADVDEMRAMRPQVDGRFRRVVGALGYVVQATNDEHSGQTYRVKYPGDQVKVDISYLARVPLLDPEELTCQFADPPVAFPVLRFPELVAGKVKAIIERTAVRDLYDLYQVATAGPAVLQEPLARALTIRALCTADPFPFVKDPVVALERFEDPAPELSEPLSDMLPAGDEPDHEKVLRAVGDMLSPLSSLSKDESEFVRLLEEDADYRPELLFQGWPAVLDRASADPVMVWKVKNLAQRPREHGA